MSRRKGESRTQREWLSDPNISDRDLRLMQWLDSHTPEYLATLTKHRIGVELGWSKPRVYRSVEALVSLGLVREKKVPCVHGGERSVLSLSTKMWQRSEPVNKPPTDGSAGVTSMGPLALPTGSAGVTSNGSAGVTPTYSTLHREKNPPATSERQPRNEWEVFDREYPNNTGRSTAQRTFSRLSPTEKGQAVRGLRLWKREWALTNNQFAPGMAKFIEEQHYKKPPTGTQQPEDKFVNRPKWEDMPEEMREFFAGMEGIDPNTQPEANVS